MGMITVSKGSHRFESGPTYHFNGSNFGELSDVIIDPTSTVDYVNVLPGVNATPEEIRDVAASGIARLAVQGPEMSLLDRTGAVFVDVVGGGTIDRSQFANRYSGRWDSGKDVFGGGLANQVLDSASVLATRKNDEEETAKIIRETLPTDEGYFVIALANGGLISAARTYLHLGEGDHQFGMVQFSRHKSHHSEPQMTPYHHERKEWFKRRAEGREVVVFDEDHSTGETLKVATRYFAGLLETRVLGIAPVEVERRITFNPLVIKPEASRR
jgi:hypoxanthine-guanine phosphoribosyltransferase